MNFTCLSVLAQDGGAEGSGGAAGAVILVVQLAVIILAIVGMWKVFEKAGKPGWGAIIPIYNIVLLLEIVGKPIWWIILLFIPCVGIVVTLILFLELAKCFGKSAGFGIGLFLLGFIFFPMLGFSDAKYRAPQKG
jgi:hypothetical protein